MKKGIILLVTLFFIVALSTLVMKNLDDTDKFLQKQNYIFNTTQILISIIDTQKEVSKLIVENKNDIEEALKNGALVLPLNLQGIDIEISFNYPEYERNINELGDPKKKENIKKLLEENNIFNFELLDEIYQSKLQNSGKIINDKQVDAIINTFSKRTYSKDIYTIKDKFGFIDKENLYKLNIVISYHDLKAKAHYYLNSQGKVEYFDVVFI